VESHTEEGESPVKRSHTPPEPTCHPFLESGYLGV
jgi:hypothetical protein